MLAIVLAGADSQFGPKIMKFAFAGALRISVFVTAAILAGADMTRPAGAEESAFTTRHLAKLAALAPGTWLDLGRPAPDAHWGRARGRSWTPSMAFARSLNGAFLYGEGRHGWYNRKTGRYMDDLWFYDVAHHRWRNYWPGTDTRNPPKLSVNEDGFPAGSDGMPIPIAQMIHGYNMTTWDSRRRRFLAMPNPNLDYMAALPSVLAFLKRNRERLNHRQASPWMFDPATRRWARHRTSNASPPSSHGDVLIYLSGRDQVFFMHRTSPWFYKPAAQSWRRPAVTGARPPWGIEANACYDPGRQRIYMGGGNYPVAKGPNALWIYDLDADRFIDPDPAGSPGGNLYYGAAGSMLLCDTSSGHVLLFRYGGRNRGIFAYDPDANGWRTVSRGLPAMWPDDYPARASSGFYHPGLNLHFFHVAGDSVDNGRILVYRYAR